MSFAPTTPYQPYANVHEKTEGPGDARPTALQIVEDNNAEGKLKGKTILITGTSAGITTPPLLQHANLPLPPHQPLLRGPPHGRHPLRRHQLLSTRLLPQMDRVRPVQDRKHLHGVGRRERHYGSKGLHGLSVHPGGIRTELGRHLQRSDYESLGFDKLEHIFKSPAQGAATTVWAAVSDHFEGKNGGRYLSDCGECGPLPPDAQPAASGYAEHIYNEENEERLWKLSNELLGLPAED